MKLKYSNQLIPSSWDPLEKWEEGIPIGNGRLGAMVMGVVNNEILQLNEDSIWSGEFQDRNNKNSLENIHNIKKMVRENQIEEVERDILPTLGGTPTNMRVYQTMGNLTINTSHKKISNYKRELDLDTAIACVSYSFNSIDYKREYFSSLSHDILIIRFTASKLNSISFTSYLGRGIYTNESGIINDNIFMTSGSNGINFATILGEKHTDGKVFLKGDHLIVENSSEVILYIDCQTSERSNKYFEKTLSNIENIKNYDFDILKNQHISKYQSQYLRMKFQLTEDSNKTTDYLLKNCNKYLAEITQLYVNFSRYLIISSSQKETNPINLQGIWCKDMDPPWGSKYTININAQMNYWPTDISNLSDCYEPFFNLLKKMHINGKKTAKEMYGCRGFVAHSNTNIHGDTAPQDYWMAGTTWVMGAAWMCTHIFEHYQYTKDIKFLKKHFYLIEDSCLFFVDFMETNDNKVYVCNPSLSPENSYKLSNGEVGTISYGCTMDSQILRFLMGQYKSASKILNFKSKNYNEIINIFDNLPQTEIHSNGTIKEWLEEYIEHEPGHRHISHLFGLFPGEEIRHDKDLIKAAKKTINRRLEYGGAHTGWSRAWMMNFYSVLKEPEDFLDNLIKLFNHSTLPNLLDNHPPFQIDGNFGALNAILMSYAQFFNNTIYLLPSCPHSLKIGEIKGIKLKENIILDIKFSDFNIDYITLISKENIDININYNNKINKINLKGNIKFVMNKFN